MTIIHDQGYRVYDGERSGIGWSMWSLGVDAARRSFGLKRPAKHKILPALSVLIAFVPALIFVGIAAAIGSEFADSFISYGDYLGFIGTAITLFAALVAPDVLSTDRRTGMLALYMASPLDRTTYIISKLTAVFAILLVITMFPLLFLLIGRMLVGAGPDGFGDFLSLLFKIVASGLIVSLFYTGLTMAISSFTKRRGIASIAIVGVMLIPTIAVNGVLNANDDVSDTFGLLDISNLPFFSSARLFDSNAGDEGAGLGQLSTGSIMLATVAIAVVCMAVVWWQYQRVEIDR